MVMSAAWYSLRGDHDKQGGVRNYVVELLS